MPNLIEAVKSAFHTIADDEPTLPLNIMEASSMWFYYTMAKEAISFEEAELNTTMDDELKGMLNDALKMCHDHANRLEKIMREEAVPFPAVAEPKPKTDPKGIPPGVKLTDDEIANGLAVKIIAMALQASTAATQCVRTDIGMMWARFLNETLAYGMTLKTKMRKRGWAKMPPPYTPPGK